MTAVLDQPRSAGTVRYQVLAWLCAATVIAYVHRGCLAVAQKDVSDELGLSAATMGDIMAAFFLTYALFQLPAGSLGQHWGTRRALPAFVVVWSAFTGVAALALGGAGLMASRLGMGAAQAGIFPCATSSLARWFPATQRATVSGALGSCMGVGGAIGTALTGVLLGGVDWRWLFVLYALPGFAWAAAFYLWFRDRPEDHPAVNAAELDLIREGAAPGSAASESGREPVPWGQIFSSPVMWWINAQQFLRAGAFVFYLSWFPTYLMETRDVSTEEAGWLGSLPLCAQVLGCAAGGVTSDFVLARTRNRRSVPIISLTVCTTLVVLSSGIADARLAVLVITAGAFCASVAGPVAYATSIDLGGRHVAAVFSVMNMAGNVGAILLPMVIPRVVEATGSWDLALYLFASLHVVAAVCWFFINPSKRVVSGS